MHFRKECMLLRGIEGSPIERRGTRNKVHGNGDDGDVEVEVEEVSGRGLGGMTPRIVL